MDDLLSFVFSEILGNLFFRVGRIILRVVTLGAVRLENLTRFQMFIVAIFGFLVGFSAALFVLNLVFVWVFK